LRGRRKRGPERNALGRSRGGFSTEINARTNSEGLPMGIVITPGQAHDVTAFPALMQEIDCDPDKMLGDKGYDSEAVRDEIQQRGGEAEIPSTATRKIQHTVDKAVYALRNRIEHFFNRAKNSPFLRPSHLPADTRLRSRAARSFATKRAFSYSANDPAI
jgi:transposase